MFKTLIKNLHKKFHLANNLFRDLFSICLTFFSVFFKLFFNLFDFYFSICLTRPDLDNKIHHQFCIPVLIWCLTKNSTSFVPVLVLKKEFRNDTNFVGLKNGLRLSYVVNKT